MQGVLLSADCVQLQHFEAAVSVVFKESKDSRR